MYLRELVEAKRISQRISVSDISFSNTIRGKTLTIRFGVYMGKNKLLAKKVTQTKVVLARRAVSLLIYASI